MTRRWTLRLVAGLAAGALVLSGCSERQEAADTLPEADAPSSEPELPPLGPPDLPMPAEARQKTPEGAVQFMRYYMALNAHVAEGPLDSTPLLDLSAECTYCQELAESYDEDRSAGYTYGDFTYSFQDNGPGLLSGDTAEVGFVYSQSAANTYDSSGQLVADRSAPESGTRKGGAHLSWDVQRTSWIVTSMSIG